MNKRQRVEKYWSIWKLSDSGDDWHPYDEGITTRRRAEEELRELLQDGWPGEEFCIVRTTHERVRERRKK
jgi:hypothetical protein